MNSTVKCALCEKTRRQVRYMVAGENGNAICAQCVNRAQKLIMLRMLTGSDPPPDIPNGGATVA